MAVNESLTCWCWLGCCTASRSESNEPADQPASVLQTLRILCQHWHNLGPSSVPCIVSLEDLQHAQVWAYILICVLTCIVCVCVCARARLSTRVSSWLFGTAVDLRLSADDEGKSDTLSASVFITHIYTPLSSCPTCSQTRDTHTHTQRSFYIHCPVILWRPRGATTNQSVTLN